MYDLILWVGRKGKKIPILAKHIVPVNDLNLSLSRQHFNPSRSLQVSGFRLMLRVPLLLADLAYQRVSKAPGGLSSSLVLIMHGEIAASNLGFQSIVLKLCLFNLDFFPQYGSQHVSKDMRHLDTYIQVFVKEIQLVFVLVT